MTPPQTRAAPLRRIPRRYAPVVFGLVLSGLMSLLVSGISTARAVPLDGAFLKAWMTAWGSSWAIAFPAVLVVAPLVRRLVDLLVEP